MNLNKLFFRFLDYLSCKRLEEEYVRIVSQSSDLLNALQAADEEQDGVLSADKLQNVLAKSFPLKTKEALSTLGNLFGSESEVSFNTK